MDTADGDRANCGGSPRAAGRACKQDIRPERGQALGTIIDLHTHTDVGSYDSRTTHADIARHRELVPALDGVALTEHSKRWTEAAIAELPPDVLVFNEREYDFHHGHIIVLGAPELRRGINVHQLREHVLAHGGLMILAHPFRFYPSSLSLLYPAWHEPGEWPPERLAGHLLFDVVDAVEAWNYRALPAQNELAEACAHIRGLPIVAGSDSHAPEDIGHYATEFEDDIRTTAEMMAAIRAGRCRPVELTADGTYRPPVRTSEFLLARASE